MRDDTQLPKYEEHSSHEPITDDSPSGIPTSNAHGRTGSPRLTSNTPLAISTRLASDTPLAISPRMMSRASQAKSAGGSSRSQPASPIDHPGIFHAFHDIGSVWIPGASPHVHILPESTSSFSAKELAGSPPGRRKSIHEHEPAPSGPRRKRAGTLKEEDTVHRRSLDAGLWRSTKQSMIEQDETDSLRNSWSSFNAGVAPADTHHHGHDPSSELRQRAAKDSLSMSNSWPTGLARTGMALPGHADMAALQHSFQVPTTAWGRFRARLNVLTRGGRIHTRPKRSKSDAPQPFSSSSDLDLHASEDGQIRLESDCAHSDLTSRLPQQDHAQDVIVVPSLKFMLQEDYKWLKEQLRTGGYKAVIRGATKRRWWKWYAIAGLMLTFGAVLSIKHKPIIGAIKPAARKLKDLPAGWLIPLALLVILSFPPLSGHEIVGILIGLVWGMWIGFGILAAGTFIGELATWFAFKGCCQGRAEKFRSKNRFYNALVQLIREKSFLFALVLRFSAIPGHIVTAISSTAGANLWSYSAAAILTLPKQLSLVYVGSAWLSTHNAKKHHMLSIITLMGTIIGTGIAAVYIYFEMRRYLFVEEIRQKAKPICDSPAANAAPMDRVATIGTSGSGSDDDKLVAAGYPPRYSEIISSPVHVTRDQDLDRHHLYARRPFLHSNSSFASSTSDRPAPMRRSRSISHTSQDAEELSRYLSLLSQRQGDAILPAEPTSNRWDSIYDMPTPSLRGVDSPLLRPSRAGRYRSDTVGTNISQISAETPMIGRFTLDPEIREDEMDGESADGFQSRGTASMDLWRPIDMTLGDAAKKASEIQMQRLRSHSRAGDTSRPSSVGPSSVPSTRPPSPPAAPSTSSSQTPRRFQSSPLSGRDLARDADEYAVRHGASRPNLGRLRGDSSAALLPRRPQ